VGAGTVHLGRHLELEQDQLVTRNLHLGTTAFTFEQFAHLDHAADVQGAVFDRADLEDVTAAGDEIADLQRLFLARKVADQLAALGDELIAKDPGNRSLHHGHPTTAHG